MYIDRTMLMEVLPCERDAILWFLDFCNENELEEYRKDPSKFLEDFFGIELFPYQKELIKDITKENQNDEKEIC